MHPFTKTSVWVTGLLEWVANSLCSLRTCMYGASLSVGFFKHSVSLYYINIERKLTKIYFL